MQNGLVGAAIQNSGNVWIFWHVLVGWSVGRLTEIKRGGEREREFHSPRLLLLRIGLCRTYYTVYTICRYSKYSSFTVLCTRR